MAALLVEGFKIGSKMASGSNGSSGIGRAATRSSGSAGRAASSVAKATKSTHSSGSTQHSSGSTHHPSAPTHHSSGSAHRPSDATKSSGSSHHRASEHRESGCDSRSKDYSGEHRPENSGHGPRSGDLDRDSRQAGTKRRSENHDSDRLPSALEQARTRLLTPRRWRSSPQECLPIPNQW